MNELPEKLDLDRLGIDPPSTAQLRLIHEGHGSRLYRVKCRGRWIVIKWLADPAESIEIRAYALLEGLGVPTLPVHGRTENALALEDLGAGPTWRPAEDADCDNAETGRAVAGWYRALHRAGRKEIFVPHTGKRGREPWLILARNELEAT
jgi:hypothetical protein